MIKQRHELKIVRLTHELIDTISPLMDDYRVFYGRKSNPGKSRNYVNKILNKGNCVLLMGIAGQDRAIGFCTLFRSYSSVRAAEIYVLNDLYVHKSHRRCGYSQQLLDAAITHAKSEGVAFLKLETAEDNLIAQNLYEKSGWKRTHFYGYGFEIVDA